VETMPQRRQLSFVAAMEDSPGAPDVKVLHPEDARIRIIEANEAMTVTNLRFLAFIEPSML
jgi:hypothetical protein